jgi:hypothetical protein
VSDMPLKFRKLYDAENQNSLRTLAGDYLYERLVDLGLIKINLIGSRKTSSFDVFCF